MSAADSSFKILFHHQKMGPGKPRAVAHRTQGWGPRGTSLSVHDLLYVCFCLQTPYLIRAVGSLTLNSGPTA